MRSASTSQIETSCKYLAFNQRYGQISLLLEADQTHTLSPALQFWKGFALHKQGTSKTDNFFAFKISSEENMQNLFAF